MVSCNYSTRLLSICQSLFILANIFPINSSISVIGKHETRATSHAPVGAFPITAVYRKLGKGHFGYVSKSHKLTNSAKMRRWFVRRDFETVPLTDLYGNRYRQQLQKGRSQKSGGYCWRTRKCRNLCTPHAFLEGKKAWETYARKSTARTSK